MSLSFEEEKEIIKLKEESEMRLIIEWRKLEQLKHENKMGQIRLDNANRLRQEQTKAELMARQQEIKANHWKPR